MNQIEALTDLPEEMYINMKCVALQKTDTKYLWTKCMQTHFIMNIVIGIADQLKTYTHTCNWSEKEWY